MRAFDRQADGQTDRQTDEQTARQMSIARLCVCVRNRTVKIVKIAEETPEL